jgi:hypothetical protein
MTFSNGWMELRGRLLPPKRGRSATDLRAAALRSWLRSCRDDPSCSVAEAVDHVRRRSVPPPPTQPSPEWLALRENLLGGEEAPGPASSPCEPFRTFFAGRSGSPRCDRSRGGAAKRRLV